SEETLRVKGEIGETVVHIHDGKASVESSPCSNQTCVAAGSIDSNGQWVACLPNGVFVRIEGSSRHETTDATIR
ncbi:MAG: NusG domain II-containing protein, partial [Treponemataceae bacterium]